MAEKKEKKTKSDEIWEKIKDLKVNIYALPNQKVEDHVERLEGVSADMVHLRLKSPAILPAMEEAMQSVKLAKGEKFNVSLQKNFTVVSIESDPESL